MRRAGIREAVKRNLKRAVTYLLTLVVCLSGLTLPSCDTEVSVATVTAEEFRFTPNQVKLPAGQKVRLIVRNQGREGHVFQSPILGFHEVRFEGDSMATQEKGESWILLQPGQQIEISLVLPGGLYPFRCRIKGHKGMEGTLVVGK